MSTCLSVSAHWLLQASDACCGCGCHSSATASSRHGRKTSIHCLTVKPHSLSYPITPQPYKNMHTQNDTTTSRIAPTPVPACTLMLTIHLRHACASLPGHPAVSMFGIVVLLDDAYVREGGRAELVVAASSPELQVRCRPELRCVFRAAHRNHKSDYMCDPASCFVVLPAPACSSAACSPHCQYSRTYVYAIVVCVSDLINLTCAPSCCAPTGAVDQSLAASIPAPPHVACQAARAKQVSTLGVMGNIR